MANDDDEELNNTMLKKEECFWEVSPFLSSSTFLEHRAHRANSFSKSRKQWFLENPICCHKMGQCDSVYVFI